LISQEQIFPSFSSGNFGNNGNPSGGYRGSAHSGPQQTYGNNYSGDNLAHPPAQQTYYSQGPGQMPAHQAQIYPQSMPNTFQQMGQQIPHPMNPPQSFDNHGYDQNYQASVPMPNRS
jgi:hypothetical protein